MQNGFNVSMPLLDASPYDAIIEKDGKLFKVQIKYISEDRKKNKSSTHISLTQTGKPYLEKYVDFFAIYFVELDGFYIIKNKGQKAMRLSTTGIYKDNFNNFALIL